jgi:hypothetical protein
VAVTAAVVAVVTVADMAAAVADAAATTVAVIAVDAVAGSHSVNQSTFAGLSNEPRFFMSARRGA